MDGAHSIMEGPPAPLLAALLRQGAVLADAAQPQVLRRALLVDLQREVQRRATNAPAVDFHRGVWANTGGPWACTYDDIRRAYVYVRLYGRVHTMTYAAPTYLVPRLRTYVRTYALGR